MLEVSQPLTIAFVLASYAPNAASGMERATAALAAGLRQGGHRVLILTAAPQPFTDPEVIRLSSLAIQFPCRDHTIRDAIDAGASQLQNELRTILDALNVEIVVYVDALWGLGRIVVDHPARSVLAVHVLGHEKDLTLALSEVDAVVAPSRAVLDRAAQFGYEPKTWSIVPNALLYEPSPPDEAVRDALRQKAPIRVLARLGAEKNVAALLDASRFVERITEVNVAAADFEAARDSQAEEWHRCKYAAAHSLFVHLRYGKLDWHDVPSWLGEAGAVIVPSTRESFGLVALEAMSMGTPVISYAVDNLPALIGTGDDAGGVVVPRSDGERGLWRAAENLLGDRVHYGHLSRAAYYRSRDFRPTTVAQAFLKAVR